MFEVGASGGCRLGESKEKTRVAMKPPRCGEARPVELSSRAVRALTQVRQSNASRLGLDAVRIDRHVLTLDGKRCITPNASRRGRRGSSTPWGSKACPHSARHAFPTELLRSGASAPEVQRLLGRSSMTLTIGSYGHIGKTDRHRATDLLDSHLDEETARASDAQVIGV